MPNKITLAIPYPPSVNRIWRYAGRGRAYRSSEYKDFLAEVAYSAKGLPSLGDSPDAREPCRAPVAVHVLAFPPDHRKRDLDNVIKAILDALTTANVWEDDSQVVKLTAERGAPATESFVIVEIARLDEHTTRRPEDFGVASKPNPKTKPKKR